MPPLCSPSGERASALVRSIYYEMKNRSFADRQLVFLRLWESTVGDGSIDDPRARWCLDALLACQRALGPVHLSKARYDKWYYALEDPSPWPSSNVIRKMFGGWSAASARHAGEPEVAVLAGRALARGAAFSRDGLLRTLRAWVAALGPDPSSVQVTFDGYATWAGAERRAGNAGGLQLPRGRDPFTRVFGSWNEALAAAGVLHARLDGRMCRPRCPAADYTPDRILETLQRAAKETGCNRLTIKVYQGWLSEELRSAALRGEVVSLPSPSTVRAVFGCWGRGLVAAGMRREDSVARRKRNNDRYTDEEMFEALETCVREIGQLRPSRGEYDRWRRRALTDRRWTMVPSSGLLRSRFGSWRNALAAWIPAGADHVSQTGDDRDGGVRDER